MSIVEQLFNVLSVCMFANQFNEPAACLARCRTSICKSGVCLLGVDERSTQSLEGVRKEHPEVLSK